MISVIDTSQTAQVEESLSSIRDQRINKKESRETANKNVLREIT